MSTSTNDSSPPQAPVDTLSTIRRGSRATATILPDIMRKVNGAYYFNQRVYAGSTPGKLNYRYINYVFYAFAFVREDGTVYLSDEHADKHISADGVNGCLESLRRRQQEFPHLTLILSIGGGGFSTSIFAGIAADPGKREHFARSARVLIDEIQFNGVDIDWEHPSDRKEGQDFVNLLFTLRKHLPSPQYKLTTALPCAEWVLRNMDVRQVADHVDFVNAMAYDYMNGDQSVHHAQLFEGPQSGSRGISYLTGQGFPPSKIILGIPCYGLSFLGAERRGQAYDRRGGNEGIFEYKDLPRPGAQEFVDKEAVAAYCVGGDGGFVSYDNAETVRMKGDFVKARGLAARTLLLDGDWGQEG